MPVKSLKPGYAGEVRDTEDRFHGLRMFYVAWDRHLMFTNPFALMLPPDTKFGTLAREVLAGSFGEHPDWPRVDWARAQWLLDGQPLAPDFDADLDANGVGFKSVLRLQTPGLDGIAGSGS